MATAQELADKYEASLEATAHRAIDLADRPGLMVVLREMHKPADRSDPAARPKLRVAYSYGVGNWPFIPRWKSAADSGPLGRASQGEAVDEVADLSELTGRIDREAHVTAKSYPFHDEHGSLHQRVIAIYR
jgi:hypothetical protein